ncbi:MULTISPECIES: Qnr family pentapeptide repeat protein [Photorhabdus]|uniref:Qnr family pentapeptide repeat protein n=1 Tax=Photorhabdus TaxID=29487 RepID=UPI000DCDF136|nr:MULTISPECIES: Qnr family pentapeptide repeat protein [Photorhabdus]MCT8344252.1 Qnr family pentapeptide repeat protein [Photorhabdus kleinii]RAW96827.1 fluoroquinolone resistance protein [Photorhabdus sp. S10-54]RAW97305.1 fluoroquinolone resistance protein [Photorhabdus sp. S9-53]RAX01370.1 fluoroquinolone resistance protein [Photorhabdus sp. S8-52]
MKTLILCDEKIGRNQFTGKVIENSKFLNCDFSGADLSETQFIGCQFYDQESQMGCNFSHAVLKDASFKSCDLSMVNFRNANALGIEIRECRAQGSDFRGTSFVNMISSRVWFCRAYITKSNLSYANFSKVILEKCELWENRWNGANILGANFSGSDLSGGEFAAFDWRAANFTHCNLTNSMLGELDIRSINLEGVKIDTYQASELMERLGIVVME